MNPQNKKIVGFENSLESLKQETIEEGKQAQSVFECPYSSDSTFEQWWMKGFYSIKGIINRARKNREENKFYH